ncbi:hypothetical protein ACFSTC_08645 [Nonomuraea ferruginea]
MVAAERAGVAAHRAGGHTHPGEPAGGRHRGGGRRGGGAGRHLSDPARAARVGG